MNVARANTLDTLGNLSGRDLVIVNGPNYFSTHWVPFYRNAQGKNLPSRLVVLGDDPVGVDFKRVAPWEFELSAKSTFASGRIALFFTDPKAPLKPGFTWKGEDHIMQVLETNDHDQPTRIRVTVTSPEWWENANWVVWNGNRYKRFVLPPVGKRLSIS